MEDTNDQVQYCTNCGTKLTADSNFCPKCGKKIIMLGNKAQTEQPTQTTQQNINSINTSKTKNDVSFVVDGNKLKQVYKAVENQGSYFNEYGSKMIWVTILVIMIGAVLPVSLLLIYQDSMDISLGVSPFMLIVILLSISGLIFGVSAISLHQQKARYLGYNHRVWIKKGWLLCMRTFDDDGLDERHVNDYTNAILINLKDSSTTLSYNSETNIIAITGFTHTFSVINNKIFYGSSSISLNDADFLSPLISYIENKDYSNSENRSTTQVPIPNCFNPDLYEYLQKIIKK